MNEIVAEPPSWAIVGVISVLSEKVRSPPSGTAGVLGSSPPIGSVQPTATIPITASKSNNFFIVLLFVAYQLRTGCYYKKGKCGAD